MLPSWQILFFLALCAIGPASFGAQDASPAHMETQALVYVRDGAIYGCGIRVIGSASDDPQPVQWFDVSVNLYREGFGIVKALSYDIRGAALMTGKPLKSVAVENAWLKPADSDAPKPQGEGIHAGDQPGSIVYPIRPDDANRLLRSLLDGGTVFIGMKRLGPSPERIFSGDPTVRSSDSRRIVSCIDTLKQRPGGKLVYARLRQSLSQ